MDIYSVKIEINSYGPIKSFSYYEIKKGLRKPNSTFTTICQSILPKEKLQILCMKIHDGYSKV